MVQLILEFVGGAKGAFAGFLMALLAFAGLFFKVRRDGRKAERAEIEAKENAGVAVAKKVEEQVKAMPSSAKKEALKKWSKS